MTYPSQLPIFTDGIPTMRDWLIATECAPGYLALERFAWERGGRIKYLRIPDPHVYTFASLIFLTPWTKLARDMFKVARGGK